MAISSTFYPTYTSYTSLLAASTTPVNLPSPQINQSAQSINAANSATSASPSKKPNVGHDYYQYSNVAAVQTSPNTVHQTSVTISDDGPPPTLVMRAFREIFNQAVNWIYNVDSTTNNNQQNTFNRQPVYHLFSRTN